ncbi:hypothetical protein IWW50_001826 [Coemansia erecta]|nr:hypothetical protein IWW50_001826 [Coemansia erecta]
MPNTNPTPPPGFVKRYDAQTGYHYYVNIITGSSQWTLPRVSAYALSQIHPGSGGLMEGTIDPDTVPPPHGYHDYATQSVSSEYQGLGQASDPTYSHNQYYQQQQSAQQHQVHQYYQQQQEHMLSSQQLMQHSNAQRVHRTHSNNASFSHTNGGSHSTRPHRQSHSSTTHSSRTHSRPSTSRPSSHRHRQHSGNGRHGGEGSTGRYRALTGILAGGLAAFGLHQYMDDIDMDSEYFAGLQGQMDNDMWFDEY